VLRNLFSFTLYDAAACGAQTVVDVDQEDQVLNASLRRPLIDWIALFGIHWTVLSDSVEVSDDMNANRGAMAVPKEQAQPEPLTNPPWGCLRRTLVSLAATAVSAGLIFNPQGTPLVSSVGFSILGAVVTFDLIPILGPQFMSIGLSGRDLSKKSRPVLPESMGAVAAQVYLFCMVFFTPFMFYKYLVTVTSGGGNREQGFEEIYTVNHGRTLHLFPHNKLAEYLSAVLCLQSMLILGMADDLFDIRWRNKFFLPAIAAIPLLVVYYVDFGITKIVLPPFLNLGSTMDLGALYYVYMASVAIFCPNAINILAGVNGLEVGQAVVIAMCILVNDMLYIFLLPGHPAMETHLFSAYLLLPLLGVSCALLAHNWWPARVFVGDTYCYFAGMVFAVVGILGHFSKTLLLFFVPQIFNFVYSVPQLFKIVECPRHRLPKFNVDTGLLEPSRARIRKGTPGLVKWFLRILARVRLIGIWETTDEEVDFEISNLTLINLVIVQTGPIREDKVTVILLGIQLVCGLVAIVIRHTAATFVFGRDNL
jgi:UDP-N-acetylglucosamine--dolichyl-phosphate N-acetylglucosaminephosphotransferase